MPKCPIVCPRRSARARSALMYAGVPTASPSCVLACMGTGEHPGFNPGPVTMTFANPKSNSLMVPSGRNLMFAGFRSR